MRRKDFNYITDLVIWSSGSLSLQWGRCDHLTNGDRYQRLVNCNSLDGRCEKYWNLGLEFASKPGKTRRIRLKMCTRDTWSSNSRFHRREGANRERDAVKPIDQWRDYGCQRFAYLTKHIPGGIRAIVDSIKGGSAVDCME